MDRVYSPGLQLYNNDELAIGVDKMTTTRYSHRNAGISPFLKMNEQFNDVKRGLNDSSPTVVSTSNFGDVGVWEEELHKVEERDYWYSIIDISFKLQSFSYKISRLIENEVIARYGSNQNQRTKLKLSCRCLEFVLLETCIRVLKCLQKTNQYQLYEDQRRTKKKLLIFVLILTHLITKRSNLIHETEAIWLHEIFSLYMKRSNEFRDMIRFYTHTLSQINCKKNSHIDDIKLKDLTKVVSSILDVCFQNYRTLANVICSLCDRATILQHCQILRKDSTPLWFNHQSSVTDLENKLQNVERLETLVLCELISIKPSYYSSATPGTKSILRNGKRYLHTISEINDKIQEISQLLCSFTDTLNHGLSTLFKYTNFPLSSDQSLNAALEQTGISLMKVKHMGKLNTEYESVKQLVIPELRKLLDIWERDDFDGSNSIPFMNNMEKRLLKASSKRISKGLDLHILRTAKEIERPVAIKKLESEVEIRDISDPSGDFDLSDEYDSDTATANKKSQDLTKLSDLELRNHLNESILRFAAENRRDRSIIRRQKSLNLLRTRNNDFGLASNDTSEMNSYMKSMAPESNSSTRFPANSIPIRQSLFEFDNIFYTEENIPVIYELLSQVRH